MSVPFAIGLAVAVLGLGFGSRRLGAYLAVELELRPFAAGALSAAIGTGLFLTSAALAGRVFRSFDAGVWTAAAVGIGLAAAARFIPARTPVRGSRRTELLVGLAIAGSLFLYGRIAFMYQMHDEHALFGHKAMVEQLRRGTYPVYFPPMPEHEARYHYGFDILAGSLARGFGASSDLAIDLVALALILFMGWAAAAVAAACDAERSAPLAVVLVHLGGGLASLMLAGDPGRHPRCLTQFHHPTCDVELWPPQIMNVFQHPVSLGIPMALVLVILLPKIVLGARKVAMIAGITALPILSALALGQLVYYVLATTAAVAALPVWLYGSGPGKLVRTLGLFALLWASFAVAYAMGGMLAPHPLVDTHLVVLREAPGFPKDAGLFAIAWTQLANVGVAFALLPVFVAAVLQDRRPEIAMMTAFGIGGLLVAQLFNYVRSWDIVKFPSASAYVLSILYAVVVDRALADRPFPFTWIRRAGAAVAIATGVTTAAFVAFPLKPGWKLYTDTAISADPVVQKTIDWWIGRGYDDREVIYAQKNIAKELAVFGGLSTVGADSDFYYLGVEIQELLKIRALDTRVKYGMEEEALRKLHIRWVMASDEEHRSLGPVAKRALDDPARFELMHTVEDSRPMMRRRIWRLKTTPTSTAGASRSTRPVK